MSYNAVKENNETVPMSNLGLNFWILLFGKIISQLGDGIFNLALPWYILSITNSATYMSLYLVLSNIVCGISTVIFGKYVDRWKREKILYITDIIRGAYILFLFCSIIFEFSNQLVWIYICAVVLNICSSLFTPASMSIIPEIVNDHCLLKANSLLSAVNNLISLIGLAVGGVVYQIFGIKLIFFTTGIAYILSGVSETFIHPIRNDKDKKEDNASWKEGVKYLFENNKILFIIIFALVWNYIYISIYSIYIPYLFNVVYESTIADVAIIQITLFMGMLIGAGIALKYNLNEDIYKRLTQVVILQMPVFILLPIILAVNQLLMHSIFFIVISFSILFFILGLTIAIVNVNVGVILQSETKGEFLGRIYSFKSLGSMISMALGLLVGGIIIERINFIFAFTLQAVLFVILTLTMIKKFVFSNHVTNQQSTDCVK